MNFGTQDRPYQQIATVGGRVERAGSPLAILEKSDHATVVAPKWQEEPKLSSVTLGGGREIFFLNGPQVLFPVTAFPEGQPKPDILLSGPEFLRAVDQDLIRLYGDFDQTPQGVAGIEDHVPPGQRFRGRMWQAPARGNIYQDRQWIAGWGFYVEPNFSGFFDLDWRRLIQPVMFNMDSSGRKQEFFDFRNEVEGRLRSAIAGQTAAPAASDEVKATVAKLADLVGV